MIRTILRVELCTFNEDFITNFTHMYSEWTLCENCMYDGVSLTLQGQGKILDLLVSVSVINLVTFHCLIILRRVNLTGAGDMDNVLLLADNSRTDK